MKRLERFWNPYIPISTADTVEEAMKEKPYKIWQPTNERAKAIGWGTIIGALCDIGKDVEIGDNCLIQSSCLISNKVKIGDEVFLGPAVNILNDKYMNGEIDAPVIGDRCHIGGGTIINPGVHIGNDVFICSGALITKDVPDGMRIEPEKFDPTLHINSRMPERGRVVW